MTTVTVPTSFYCQFDADVTADVAGESYGGWQTQPLPLSIEHTAVVVMHAWDAGTPARYPGWFRAVEYLPRSYRIAETVFPPVLAAARSAGVRVMHVVGGRDYYSHLAGFAGGAPDAPPVGGCTAEPDRVYAHLREFQPEHVFPGAHNRPDIDAGTRRLDFLRAAAPVGDETVAATSADLLRRCRDGGINHLIYLGFAINACLLMSPGGMLDMQRQGYLCSTVREGVTAVENRETARTQSAKDLALWGISVFAFGFVYGAADLTRALRSVDDPTDSGPQP